MTQTYSPGVMALLDNPTTCPPNLLLFFHNKKWLDLVLPHDYINGSSAVSKVPLFNRIRDHHADALEDLKEMAESWNSLEKIMVEDSHDAARFYGVQARFAQQQVDAAVFRDTIIGYYGNLSGLV